MTCELRKWEQADAAFFAKGISTGRPGSWDITSQRSLGARL